MAEVIKEDTQKATKFIGEVSDPFCLPQITQGLVGFKLRYLQGDLLLSKAAQLISQSGKAYPVMVRGIGKMHPSQDPRDFMIRVDGVGFEKAKEMRKLVQEHVPDQ